MRDTVFTNRLPASIKAAQLLLKLLKNGTFTLEQRTPQVDITLGGDGTLLSAFHRYADQLDTIRFIGDTTGTTHFYTDWRHFTIQDLVLALKTHSGQSVSYPLLDVRAIYADATSATYLALLQATLLRLLGTMRTTVYIKGDFFTSFRGDGLCVSTPTGSTAYSKSNGGADITPRLHALQITEIASINNRVFRTLSSPIITAPDTWVTYTPTGREHYDNTVHQFDINPPTIKQIRYKIAKERLHFARYRQHTFWDRVEDAFIGAKT